MPRDAAPAIPLLPTLRWPHPASYWEEPWRGSGEAQQKYRAMSEALATPEATRAGKLRGLATRWPGSLREAQITEPARYWARRSALDARPDDAPRAAWRERGCGAIPLWLDLHGLLEDVARMRHTFQDPLAALDPARRACWPSEPSRWPSWVLRRFDARLARAWLCSVAGIDPAQLDAVLRG